MMQRLGAPAWGLGFPHKAIEKATRGFSNPFDDFDGLGAILVRRIIYTIICLKCPPSGPTPTISPQK